MIALGESLIAAEIALAHLPRDAAFAVGTIVTVIAICDLWWLYPWGVAAGLTVVTVTASSASDGIIALTAGRSNPRGPRGLGDPVGEEARGVDGRRGSQ
jgi:hypothetical protein